MSKKITQTLLVLIVIVVAASFILYQRYLVAATVNGKTISRLSVIAELEKQGGKKVLDSVITQELIIQKAQKEKVVVSQKEIDEQLKKIESGLKAQGGTLDEALSQQGMTKEDLLTDMRLQLTLQKLVKADEIKVTDEEVEKYLDENKDSLPEDEESRPSNDEIKDTLKQEKLQAKIQEYIAALQKEAKIDYFGSYK